MNYSSFEDFEKSVCGIAYSCRVNDSLEVHSWMHTLRVVNYAKMIALSEFPESLDDILVASYFHDVGRNTDEWEPLHGRVSVAIAKGIIPAMWPFVDFNSIAFAVNHHSDTHSPDGRKPVVDNYIIPDGLNPNVAKALWDADRLDLVRMESYRPVKLDYLSTKTAKDFANTKKHMDPYLI